MQSNPHSSVPISRVKPCQKSRGCYYRKEGTNSLLISLISEGTSCLAAVVAARPSLCGESAHWLLCGVLHTVAGEESECALEEEEGWSLSDGKFESVRRTDSFQLCISVNRLTDALITNQCHSVYISVLSRQKMHFVCNTVKTNTT